MSELWVIRKHGLFYRPNRAGYAQHVHEAGRYTREEAELEASIEPDCMSASPLSDWLPDLWQPIETAPKDKKPFSALLYVPGHGPVVAMWCDPYERCPGGTVGARWISRSNNTTIKRASHWMPLPPPPSKGDGHE